MSFQTPWAPCCTRLFPDAVGGCLGFAFGKRPWLSGLVMTIPLNRIGGKNVVKSMGLYYPYMGLYWPSYGIGFYCIYPTYQLSIYCPYHVPQPYGQVTIVLTMAWINVVDMRKHLQLIAECPPPNEKTTQRCWRWLLACCQKMPF